MSNEYETHLLTHDDKNPNCEWCQGRACGEGETVVKNHIEVLATLPVHAYNWLDEAPDSEYTLSTHVFSVRGLQNAIQRARDANREYTRTHGNGAARRIRVKAAGRISGVETWENALGILAMHDRAFSRDTLLEARLEVVRPIDWDAHDRDMQQARNSKAMAPIRTLNQPAMSDVPHAKEE